MTKAHPWTATVGVAVVLLLAIVGAARGQDMEPHAYSATPINTNFLIANYTRTTGGVSLDASLPITDVKASINIGALAYDRTFDLFGDTASAAIIVPYLQGQVTGKVFTEGREVTRFGVGDIRLRFTDNFIGNPAQSPKEFAERTPTTTVGASLTILAPTGDYNPAHLVNIGSNRWAFRPGIGLSQPVGDWFVDAAAAAWLFADNHDFFQGHRRGQSPLILGEVHAGYNFRPGLWLAGDALYYSGGETSINGIASHDSESAWRYGLTLSVPVADGFSAKLAWASWLTAHNGGAFNTIGVSLQFRWFDP
jgi:hypothetical protein